MTTIRTAIDHWISNQLLTEGYRSKFSLMTSYLQRSNGISEVPDPYFGGPQGFETVLDLLEDACSGLLTAIKSDNPAVFSWHVLEKHWASVSWRLSPEMMHAFGNMKGAMECAAQLIFGHTSVACSGGGMGIARVGMFKLSCFCVIVYEGSTSKCMPWDLDNKIAMILIQVNLLRQRTSPQHVCRAALNCSLVFLKSNWTLIRSFWLHGCADW